MRHRTVATVAAQLRAPLCPARIDPSPGLHGSALRWCYDDARRVTYDVLRTTCYEYQTRVYRPTSTRSFGFSGFWSPVNCFNKPMRRFNHFNCLRKTESWSRWSRRSRQMLPTSQGVRSRPKKHQIQIQPVPARDFHGCVLAKSKKNCRVMYQGQQLDFPQGKLVELVYTIVYSVYSFLLTTIWYQIQDLQQSEAWIAQALVIFN